MAFTSSGLDAALSGLASAGTHVSFHSADPGTTGTGEITAAGRHEVTWGSPANGTGGSREREGSQVEAEIAGGTTVTHWGLWDASTSGNFLFGGALDAPESFGSDGTLRHTPTLRVANP